MAEKSRLLDRFDRIEEEIKTGEIGTLASVAEMSLYLYVLMNSNLRFQVKEEFLQHYENLYFWCNAHTMVKFPELSPSHYKTVDEFWTWMDTSIKGSGGSGQPKIVYADIQAYFEPLAFYLRQAVIEEAIKEGVRRPESSTDGSEFDTLDDAMLLEAFGLEQDRMDPRVVLTEPTETQRQRLSQTPKMRPRAFNPQAGAGALKPPADAPETKLLPTRKLKPREQLGFGRSEPKRLKPSSARLNPKTTDPSLLPPTQENDHTH